MVDQQLIQRKQIGEAPVDPADPRLLHKFLKDVANTARHCPGLHSTAPNYVNGELAESTT